MPKGSKVEKMFKAMVKQGTPEDKAARIAQAKTKQSLVTGRKAKTHKGKPVAKAKKKP